MLECEHGLALRATREGEMKTKRKILLLAISKAEKEKRLDELNQKLGITHPHERIEFDREEMEEREWLKRKLGYGRH